MPKSSVVTPVPKLYQTYCRTRASFRDIHIIPTMINYLDNAQKSQKLILFSSDCNYALSADGIVNPDIEYRS